MQNTLILDSGNLSLSDTLKVVSSIPQQNLSVKIHTLADRHLELVVKILKSVGCEIWVDYKLHDTHDTVSSRVAQIKDAGASAISVHASGGCAMIKAAKDIGIYTIAITLLSTMTDKEVRRVYGAKSALVILRLAKIALEGGADALVCPPKQVANLCNFLQTFEDGKFAKTRLIVPGTRSVGKSTHDQQQVLTPHDAIRFGADHLVIGRQCTESLSPSVEWRLVEKEILPAVEQRKKLELWKG